VCGNWQRTYVSAEEELTCQELVELVSDYLEDRLESDERARFEPHLVECEGCRAYVEQMRHTISLLGSLSPDSVEPDVRDRLLAIFRDWKGARGSLL
jgi:anti-sigma factor RsiW